MSEISVWSIVPAQNGTLGSPPTYWPEGQAPSTVNNCARQMMSSLRIQMQDAQWFNWGYDCTRIAGNKFRMAIGTASATVSVVANFVANRRIKLYDSSTLYAAITEGSLSGSSFNVTVTLDSGSLTNSFSSAYLSILTPSNTSIPSTVATAGGLRSFQMFTTGTAATYTKPAGISSILVECQGGGGGGGGADAGLASSGAGGGGGGGGYCRKYYSTAASTYTYTVGAAGTAGATGNNAGGNGGDTSFDTIAAGGGLGGGGSAAAASGTTTGPKGAAGSGGTASGGDIDVEGNPGFIGIGYGSTMVQGGVGGSSFLCTLTGEITIGDATAANGDAASNQGGGGSGGATLNTVTTAAGGAGFRGVIIVWEFS